MPHTCDLKTTKNQKSPVYLALEPKNFFPVLLHNRKLKN